MANKSKSENKFWIVDRLSEIKNGEVKVSYHLLRVIENKGFISPKFVKITEGRGRGKKFYELTGKGKSYLNLSKNWKRA
jgi:DNA-binding PadR family transcriptional regulator